MPKMIIFILLLGSTQAISLLPRPLSPFASNLFQFNDNVQTTDNVQSSQFYCAALGLTVNNPSQCPQRDGIGQARVIKSPSYGRALGYQNPGNYGKSPSSFDIFESQLASGTYSNSNSALGGFGGWGSVYSGGIATTPKAYTTYNSYSPPRKPNSWSSSWNWAKPAYNSQPSFNNKFWNSYTNPSYTKPYNNWNSGNSYYSQYYSKPSYNNWNVGWNGYANTNSNRNYNYYSNQNTYPGWTWTGYGWRWTGWGTR